MDGLPTMTAVRTMFAAPMHVWVPKLLKSRDDWKRKALGRRRQVKLAQLTVRDLTRSRDAWRDQAHQLQRQLQQQAEQLELLRRERDRAVAAAAAAQKKVERPADAPPRGGRHPVSVVALSVQLVVDAGCSLRGAAAVLTTLAARRLVAFAVPAASTIRAWILRLGHAELTRPLDRAPRWFWLIDHTIQVGDQKLLVILGGSLDRVPFGERPLARGDLRLVALVPMTHSTGDAVERQLEVAALRTGRPRLIVSDQGCDLVKGIREYADLRPEVAHVADAAHVGANLLKASWESQPAWSEFLGKLQETATKLRPSSCAELTPPRLRPKGRFMNLEVQLRFVRMLLTRLDGPAPDPRVAAHYGWLREYRAAVTEWLAEHELVRRTIRHLRRHGLHRGTQRELNGVWKELGIGGRAGLRSLARSWCGYVRRYRPRAEADRYVASTEVLESSFGTLKRLAHQQGDSGLTGLVLAMGLIVGTRSDEQVRASLNATPQKAVDRWRETWLGKSIQWLRRQLLATPKT